MWELLRSFTAASPQLPQPVKRDAPKSFQYDQLDPGDDTIRLLSICPRRPEDRCIQCRLSIVQLSEWKGTYSAVSYAWGNDEPSFEISVNARGLLVRQNLYEFLEICEKKSLSGPLWIDAICV